MASESQSIGRSMGILCITLCFIYVVFFGVRGDAIQDEVAYLTQQYGTSSVAIANVFAQENTPSTVKVIIPPSVVIPTTPTVTVVAPDTMPGRRFYSAQELFRPEESTIQRSKTLLVDTWEWEGHMKSLAAVGLIGREQYILKNMDNTHFVFLGNYKESLISSIATKGGNVVEIVDKNAIKQHQLFGDTVWFINLPEYKNIKVLMLVFFEDKGDTWFLQIDHDIYQARKQSLANTFDTRYDR